MSLTCANIDKDAILKALGGKLEPWHHQCHAASVAIVRARIFPEARVARGHCKGVGVHSWVVLGMDCYDKDAVIIDPTLWSYDPTVTGIWIGDYGFPTETEVDDDLDDVDLNDADYSGDDYDPEDPDGERNYDPVAQVDRRRERLAAPVWPGRHLPDGGFGLIWNWGRPSPATGPAVKLTPTVPLSRDARNFIDMLGPLDEHGWATLVSRAPRGGWPADEIIAAMDDTEKLAARVPVDRLGMWTMRNPGGLYL